MNKILKSWILPVIACVFLVSSLGSCIKDGLGIDKFIIEGFALNAITYEKLSGASVSLTQPGYENFRKNISIDEAGKYRFALKTEGTYHLTIEKAGYKNMYSAIVTINRKTTFVTFLPSVTSLSTPIGGITGTVYSLSGQPLIGANVSISAQNEELTNGYFSSVETNELGQFYIGAVPLQTTKEFKIRCISDNYKTQVLQNIKINPNEMVHQVFELEPATPPVKVFYENFESNATLWEMSGFWHIRPNGNTFNGLYPVYVKIAPNDPSLGKLPGAFKGTQMAWYGNQLAGNYLGDQSVFDYENSGGTSKSKNSGTLISPIINLGPLEEASLNFWSWFEIESVNPNQMGYDLMEIYVIESTGNMVHIGKLNPYTDPIIPERKSIPFTSGGFNQHPVWKFHEFDLSRFSGSAIKIQFRFDTRDGLYNGFRGWCIDEVGIVNKGLPGTKCQAYTPPPLMERRPE